MQQLKRSFPKLVLALFLTVLITGCGSSKQTSVEYSKPAPAAAIAEPSVVLQAQTDAYLKQNRPLFVEPQEILEKAVAAGDQSYYLVDIRNDDHYANAHIPGAIHIAYADVWRQNKIEYLPKDKKIIIIDYSGHTASQVAAFWGMLGFDAVAMKNGMAGWTREKEAIGGAALPCEAQNYPVVTMASLTPVEEFSLPQMETKATNFTDLLIDRSQTATAILPVIQSKDFKDSMKKYSIIDIRQPEHYAAGHVEGAVNIPFRTIAEMQNLKKLSPDKEIVVICYDGHASSQAARLLNQLGYHATVLKDGMSAWITDEKVIGAKPIACNIAEKPVVKLNAPLEAGPSMAAT